MKETKGGTFSLKKEEISLARLCKVYAICLCAVYAILLKDGLGLG